MVDAPVSGGDVGAKAASLTIMVGGPEAAFENVKPLFEKMGKNITLVGGNGDGQTCKVANQIIVALTIEAVGEALLFASKAGADPAKVRQALMGGFAASRILEVHGERMIKRTFDPGFRIELHQKDLNLALSAGKALGVALPNTATCQELFNSCAAHGGSAWDHSGMLRALEIVSETAGNVVIAKAVDDARGSVREGQRISSPLAASGMFPQMVTQMIDIGEETAFNVDRLVMRSRYPREFVARCARRLARSVLAHPPAGRRDPIAPGAEVFDPASPKRLITKERADHGRFSSSKARHGGTYCLGAIAPAELIARVDAPAELIGSGGSSRGRGASGRAGRRQRSARCGWPRRTGPGPRSPRRTRRRPPSHRTRGPDPAARRRSIPSARRCGCRRSRP